MGTINIPKFSFTGIRPRERGKTRIKSVLAKFAENERVSININPSRQNIPHPRFNGRVGKVVGSQGRAYYVQLSDGGKMKKVLVTPEHLRRIEV